MIIEGFLWCAPEILMSYQSRSRGSKAGDVFSFGLIILEIFLKQIPYDHFKMPIAGTSRSFKPDSILI